MEDKPGEEELLFDKDAGALRDRRAEPPEPFRSEPDDMPNERRVWLETQRALRSGY